MRKCSYQPYFSLNPYIYHWKAVDVAFLRNNCLGHILFTPYTFFTKLGEKNLHFHDFQYFPISWKIGLTFLETWHHEDYGSQQYFQNTIWLEGWDITARPSWTGLSPPSSRTTSPALTRMSTSVIRSVFESATSSLKSLSKISFFYLCIFCVFLRNSHFISNTPRTSKYD